MKINELLLEGRKKLSDLTEGADSSISALDSEVLLAYVLGCSREELLRDADSCEVDDIDHKLFLKYCIEVAGGRPVAYVTGKKEFYGLDFYIDERVLIPRPETEMIVDEVLGWLGGRSDETREKEVRLLDVGTGSLNITTAIVRKHGHVFAHAVDISDEALEVAQMNREAHGLETHVQLYQSDLLSAVEETDFDVIVTNLPYIGEDMHRNLDSSVERFEPSQALFGGSDGLELYKKLIQQILDKNVRFDLLVGEFGYGQAEAVEEMLNKFFDQDSGCLWEVKKDLAGIPRIFVVKKQ
jgi:release factor glutamine methyltransferase